MNRMKSDMTTRRSSSSDPLDHTILDNDPDDLSILRNASNGRLQGRYPRDLPELSHVGDGKQEPLHTSWNLPQPVREDIDRMREESVAGRAMANAEIENPDTCSSCWTDRDDDFNFRLEDWSSPELLSRLNALIAGRAEPGPETEFARTEHGFPYSYHRGLSKPYVCECIGCHRSFGTKSEMEKHQKYHLDKQNMPCECPEPGCGYTCALPHHLARHFNSVHLEERPFHCDQCDKSFKRKDGLNVHKGRLHSSTASSSGAPKTPKTSSTGPGRRRPSKSTASSSSSQIKRLSSRMDGIEIASGSSYPYSSTPTPRPYQ